MTRILHIIASVNPKGGGPIEGILQQCRTAGFGEPRTIVSLDRPDDPWVLSCPVKVHALGDTVPHFYPFERYRYSRGYINWLKSNVEKFDIVVVNGLWNYTTFGAARVLPGAKVPYVVFSHGMLDPWFKRTYPLKHLAKQLLWFWGDGALMSHAAAVLFTAEEERLLARGQFWGLSYRERVVEYGTSAPPPFESEMATEFSAAVPGLMGRSFLLYLSRIHKKKGGDLLIRAFAALADAHPQLDLVMAGPGDPREIEKLQRLARDLGVEARVYWPGMLRGAAKWGAFYLCEAFCLPSHQENFGIVVAEAMGCAKPVLISSRVNIWREIDAARAGLVGPDTLEGTAGLLNGWLGLSDHAKAEYAANALSLFKEKFDSQVVNPRLEALYRELANAQ